MGSINDDGQGRTAATSAKGGPASPEILGTIDGLGPLDVAAFMERYWQKEPVLLRAVFAADFCPLNTADLVELARNEEADSRLIVAGQWPPEIFHGPFEPDEFEDLPEGDWTLLVQEVDRLLPEVAPILDRFRFVPNWRVDDLMVSIAAPGGGVGAHTDQYDVFLIQGLGTRRWEIDPSPNTNPVWKEGSDVAVLEDFEAVQSWVLSPGDVLYLPPYVAHNGIALEECMTLSVGFRAPAGHEILASVVQYVTEDGGSARFRDPSPQVEHAPGRLLPYVLESLRADVRQLLADDESLNRWIGRSLTEPARGRLGGFGEPVDCLPETGRLRPVSTSQMAFASDGDGVTLFVAGSAYSLPADAEPLIAALTGVAGLDIPDLPSGELRGILEALLLEGILRVV
ncbi:MAG: 50S ribosomal protein L16 3-hydroxylase [Rhodothermales bacterium]|jgi:50S ribosomal protein L16 3-hydroxylase